MKIRPNKNKKFRSRNEDPVIKDEIYRKKFYNFVNKCIEQIVIALRKHQSSFTIEIPNSYHQLMKLTLKDFNRQINNIAPMLKFQCKIIKNELIITWIST